MGEDPDCSDDQNQPPDKGVTPGADCSTDTSGCGVCDNNGKCNPQGLGKSCPKVKSPEPICDPYICGLDKQGDPYCTDNPQPDGTDCSGPDAGLVQCVKGNKCKDYACETSYSDAGTPCDNDAGSCDKPTCDGEGTCVDNWVDAGTPCKLTNGKSGICEPDPEQLMCVRGYAEGIASPYVGDALEVANQVYGLVNVRSGYGLHHIPLMVDGDGTEKTISAGLNVDYPLYLWHNDADDDGRPDPQEAACSGQRNGWTLNLDNEIRRKKGDKTYLRRDERRGFVRYFQDSLEENTQYLRTDEEAESLLEEYDPSGTGASPFYLYLYEPPAGVVTQYSKVRNGLAPDVECWHITAVYRTWTYAVGAAGRYSDGSFLPSANEQVWVLSVMRDSDNKPLPSAIRTQGGGIQVPNSINQGGMGREVYVFSYDATGIRSLTWGFSNSSWGFEDATKTFTTSFWPDDNQFLGQVVYPARNSGDPSTSPTTQITYDLDRSKYWDTNAQHRPLFVQSMEAPVARVDYARELPSSERITRESTTVGSKVWHVSFREVTNACEAMKSVVVAYPNAKPNRRNADEFGFRADQQWGYYRDSENTEKYIGYYDDCKVKADDYVDGLDSEGYAVKSDLVHRVRTVTQEPLTADACGWDSGSDAHQDNGRGIYIRRNAHGQPVQGVAIDWSDPNGYISERTPGTVFVQKYDPPVSTGAIPWGFVVESWNKGLRRVMTYSFPNHSFLDPLPITVTTSIDATAQDSNGKLVNVNVPNIRSVRVGYAFSSSPGPNVSAPGPLIRVQVNGRYTSFRRLSIKGDVLASGETDGTNYFNDQVTQRDLKGFITAQIVPQNFGLALGAITPDPKTGAPKSITVTNSVGATEGTVTDNPDEYADSTDVTKTEPIPGTTDYRFAGREQMTYNLVGEVASALTTLAGGTGLTNLITATYEGPRMTSQTVNGQKQFQLTYGGAPIPPVIVNKCGE